MVRRIVIFILVFQAVLLASHWFVYHTWTTFRQAPGPQETSALAVAFVVLSFTFLTASLLAWRSAALPVRIYYSVAATWLGFFNFFFLAACACWLVYGLGRALHLPWHQQDIAFLLFGLATAAGLYGLVNAARVRVRRVPVKLANLPASWRGRVAALVTDTHLGHVRGLGFAKRMVAMVSRFEPDIVLIGGDLYDGTAADVRKLAEPLRGLAAPYGAYFIAGNHEEFGDHTKYLEAVAAAGVRVLNNEKVVLDGLQLIGVHYRDATDAEHLRGILRTTGLDPGQASILLTHAPDQLAVAAEEGIGLQLSGHTHGGQFFPFTWFTRRVYGRFVYGLNQLGSLQVYTSYGAGTWGPPVRLGTRPEIVLLKFE
jgi:predicted MPP superfamily phosphohydrolase